MHQIVTFLGKYPKKTVYEYNGRLYEGEVFSLALVKFLEFDQMLVFTTNEAHASTWPLLECLDDRRILEIPIPLGESPDEMWIIFDKLIEHIQQNDTVTFDITHGLRSIPFLVFLFSAYLKTAKHATINAIYYGAFELGNQDGSKPAPVLDLSEFTTMLDWITATDQFVETGNAGKLAQLLNPSDRSRSASRKAAETLSKVSDAAFLCQPFSLMDVSRELREVLKQAEQDFSITARPFGVLSEQIVSVFDKFALEVSKADFDKVRSEYHIVDWYFHHNQLMLALSLAREWLIDAVTLRLGLPLDFTRISRQTIEKAISGLGHIGKQEFDPETSENWTFSVQDLNEYGRQIYTQWSDADMLKSIWNNLTSVRNAIDHAEHQKSPIPISTLIKKSKTIHQQLEKLAIAWKIIKPGSSVDQSKHNAPNNYA